MIGVCERSELPRRVSGTHLPAEAYRGEWARRAARGPRSASVPPEERWATGEPALRLLLNGLHRWDPDADRHEPGRREPGRRGDDR